MATLPVKSIRFGSLSAAIWEYKNEDKTQYQASVRRRYLSKKTNEWEEEKITLFDNSLLEMAELCRQTYVALQELRNANKQATPANNIQESIPAEIDMSDIPF